MYFAKKIAKVKKQQKKILANTDRKKPKGFQPPPTVDISKVLCCQWGDQSTELEKTKAGEADVSKPSYHASHICSLLCL